jgi:cytochrome c553
MNMQRTLLACAALAALLLSGCADVSRSRDLGNPQVAGTTLAQQVCSNCHGITGVTISPNFPNLAGQQPEYLVAQLKAFKSHGRDDPAGFEYMWGISRSLTDDQMKQLASYYAAQKPAVPTGQKDASIERGKAIFHSGVKDHVPACVSCHGDAGQGNGTFPRVAGQHADYVLKQLMVFQRTDERPAGVAMKAITHELGEAQMRDVAAYLQAMPAN